MFTLTLRNSTDLPSCIIIHSVTPGSWCIIRVPTIVSHQTRIRVIFRCNDMFMGCLSSPSLAGSSIDCSCLRAAVTLLFKIETFFFASSAAKKQHNKENQHKYHNWKMFGAIQKGRPGIGEGGGSKFRTSLDEGEGGDGIRTVPCFEEKIYWWKVCLDSRPHFSNTNRDKVYFD